MGNDRSNQREPHLSAVGMTGNQQISFDIAQGEIRSMPKTI